MTAASAANAAAESATESAKTAISTAETISLKGTEGQVKVVGPSAEEIALIVKEEVFFHYFLVEIYMRDLFVTCISEMHR